MSDLERRITEYIIGNIDEDGYLRRDIENIVDDLAFGAGIEVSEGRGFTLAEDYSGVRTGRSRGP